MLVSKEQEQERKEFKFEWCGALYRIKSKKNIVQHKKQQL